MHLTDAFSQIEIMKKCEKTIPFRIRRSFDSFPDPDRNGLLYLLFFMR